MKTLEFEFSTIWIAICELNIFLVKNYKSDTKIQNIEIIVLNKNKIVLKVQIQNNQEQLKTNQI